MDLTLTATLITIIIGAIYFYLKRTFSYWQRKGFPQAKPIIPFGNMQGAGRTIHQALALDKLYREMKDKGSISGIYILNSPVALVSSIELVKKILIKDFQYFVDRGIFNNERDDPLSAHLFSLTGERWRQLRTKLTPTFTSGKMKFMFNTIVDVSKQFENYFFNIVKDSKIIEIKEPLARFTTDVIGSCAFGIECNSLGDPNGEFRLMGKKFLEEPQTPPAYVMIMAQFPNLARKLGLKVIRNDVSQFFMRVVRETVGVRESQNIQRNDFMDILIKLKKNNEHSGLNLNEMSAQTFLFFVAGFETSSTTMAFALYELAKNPDIQEKLRNEINSVIEKHNGFTYEAMMDMHYLDQVINETLRLYPPVATILRRSTADYKIPDTNQVIEKGTLMFIPSYSIQRDAEHYPNPEKFLPERFAPSELVKRESVTFLAFGDGPRNCIGLRFGMMQARIGLISLLKNFEISTCSQTLIPMKFKPNSLFLAPDGKLSLNFKKINK